MAADMANANGDLATQYARISERVENQGHDIVDLRSNMNTGFRNLESLVNALATELRGSSKTQWPVLLSAVGVAFAILVAAGSQALTPIRDNLSDTKAAIVETNRVIQALAASTVSQQEMKWRTDRGAEDRKRTDDSIIDLRASTVTRNEWQERNRARDQELLDLGRRVDEIRQEVGAVYGTRDVIQDMKKEIDNLRQRLNARMPAPLS